MKFDPDELLAALPRTDIELLPPDTVIPGRRSFGDVGSDYNGFTGKARMRTFGVAKWLICLGAMSSPNTCDICGKLGDQSHAEVYFDLSTWIDICRGCHTRLHQRFKSPSRWLDHLDRHSISPIHWSRVVSPEPLDLAGLLRSRGFVDPIYETFVARSTVTR